MVRRILSVRKVCLALAVVGVAAACATAQTNHSTPAPRGLIAELTKYSQQPIDPKKVAVVTVIDADGNVGYIVPEGVTQTEFRAPIKATSLNNADSIGVSAFSQNPTCVLIVGAGGRYWYCIP